MNNYSNRPAAPRVGVVGATGYAGCELLNRLARHPGVELVAAMSSGRGEAPAVAELAAAYHGRTELVCTPASVAAMREARADFVFLCTPPEISTEWVEGLRAAGAGPRVIDLSGAYRFRDDVVYGWPEKNSEAVRTAALVSNPGCYATAALTAIWPLAAAGAIDPEAVICDAKSGVSGAGKGLRADLLYAELDGNCKAYNVFKHRHAPEIARHAALGEAGAASFIFTPHLLPTSRGILATTYVKLQPGVGENEIATAYARVFTAASAPFVRIRGARLPEIKDVVHTNFCDLGWSVRGRQAVVVTTLDNLVKGAAGQALENFNLMTGWPRETALL